MKIFHLLTLCLLACSLPCHAESAPRWELGLGVGGLVMPDYRGSDESRAYLLPFPYVVYRLDWLKADRNGVNAKLFNSERIALNLSLDASPPVRSKNNQARDGMPDIKPLLGVGPSLDINLWRNEDKSARVDLRLPVRAVTTLQSNSQWAGFVFTPRLNLDLLGLGKAPGTEEGWNLGLAAGPLFADRRQNAYFYSVSDQYARTDRQAYQSRGGYAGTQMLTSLSHRYGKLWVGAYARRDSLQGAVFEDSPLVKRKSYLSAGFAITWTFAQSSEMVERDDN
jgi:outer membrane protein